VLGGHVRRDAGVADDSDHGEGSARSHTRSRMVLFLCSQSASFETGGVHVMDGAQTAH
jgi:hypothetical protein